MSKKYILSEVKPHEVSLVDEGAIQKKFVIFKSKNPKFKTGGGTMKIEEAIEMGLIDADQAARIKKGEDSKDDKVDSNVIKDLMASLVKMVKKAKDEDKPADKLADKPADKPEDKSAEKPEDKSSDEVKKLQESVDKLTKDVEVSKKAQDLIAKLNSDAAKDPKEFLVILNEIKELDKKAPASENTDEKIVKALEEVTKRLEHIELKSKGIDGQDAALEKSKSTWGGAFK